MLVLITIALRLLLIARLVLGWSQPTALRQANSLTSFKESELEMLLLHEEVVAWEIYCEVLNGLRTVSTEWVRN